MVAKVAFVKAVDCRDGTAPVQGRCGTRGENVPRLQMCGTLPVAVAGKVLNRIALDSTGTFNDLIDKVQV